MKKFMQEFKEFALRGNVVNLAVGVMIGAAFQAVVTSFTENIISPIIGLFGQQNFDSMMVEFLGITLKYGAFLTAVVNFIIQAFVIFLIVRAMNRLMSVGKKPEEPAPDPRKCPFCCSIVDDSATRCPHCTSELPAVQPDAE